MATRAVTIEIHEHPGQFDPGQKLAGVNAYETNTYGESVFRTYAIYVDDSNLATLYSEINTAVGAYDVAKL